MARAIRMGLDWTADVGFRRVLPAMRAGFASIRTAARGGPSAAAAVPGGEDERAELEAARWRTKHALAELTEVDRAEQAVAESLAAIEEQLGEAAGADVSDARRSRDLLARHRAELDAARREILARHQRHRDDVLQREAKCEAAAGAKSDGEERKGTGRSTLVGRITRAGYWLTDRLDELTAAIERRLPFLRRRDPRSATAPHS